MIIMNDDDENDNNERTTHPLASEIQGQPCQALKSTKGPHVRVCVRVCICFCVAIWLSLCHWFYLETLFIYLFMYSIIYLFQRFGHLSLSPAESRGSVWPFYSQVEWLCVCPASVCECWGGWCQRTLAEASVLKCNDTWFLLIHSHVHAKVHMYAHNCGN